MKNRNELLSDIMGWDIVNWSTAIEYWEKNTPIEISNSYSLEIGAGNNGGLSLWLALKGSKVVCSSLGGVSDKVKASHNKYNVSSLIEYQDINALSIPYHERFDAIAFKSVLGAIGRNDNFEVQKQAIQEMYKALKSGGELLFAENLTSTNIHMFLRKKYGAGKHSWRYVTIDEMIEVLSHFSQYKYITTGFLGTLGRNRKQRIILGRIDRAFLDHLIPERWRYVIIGIAKK
jgi:SAM-dependent methyltransferase